MNTNTIKPTANCDLCGATYHCTEVGCDFDPAEDWTVWEPYCPACKDAALDAYREGGE